MFEFIFIIFGITIGVIFMFLFQQKLIAETKRENGLLKGALEFEKERAEGLVKELEQLENVTSNVITLKQK